MSMAKSTSPPLFIFSEPVDRISHALTFTFLACVIAELTLLPRVAHGIKSYENWVANIIFFNSSHVMLTFVNCICVREFREIFRRKFTITKLAVFYGVLHLSFYKYFPLWDLRHSSPVGMLVFNATLFFPAFHAFRQSTGLSLVLNHRYLRSLSEKEIETFAPSDNKSRKLEHWSCYALIGGSYILGLKRALFPVGGINELLLRAAGYLLLLFSAVAICLSFAKLKNGALIKAKILFNLRNLIRCLGPFSKFGAMSGPSFHGFEYVLLQTKVTKSHFLISTHLVFLLAFVLVGYKTISDFPNFLPNWEPLTNPKFTLFLKSGGFALTYLHYYMDSVIFKMSDKDCRDTTGAILLGPTRDQT